MTLSSDTKIGVMALPDFLIVNDRNHVIGKKDNMVEILGQGTYQVINHPTSEGKLPRFEFKRVSDPPQKKVTHLPPRGNTARVLRTYKKKD